MQAFAALAFRAFAAGYQPGWPSACSTVSVIEL
jgi:hypothetical protein